MTDASSPAPRAPLTPEALAIITRPADAFDADGRRTVDVQVVHTAGGSTPHLMLSTAEKTMCGRRAGRRSRTWFAVTGCTQCTRAALRAGIATITDVDGDLVNLADVG